MAKTISINTAGTNLPIWTPSAGKKPVITNIHLTVDGNSTVTISDGPLLTGDLLVKGSFKAQSGQSYFVPISFRLPHVAQNGSSCKLSTDLTFELRAQSLGSFVWRQRSSTEQFTSSARDGFMM